MKKIMEGQLSIFDYMNSLEEIQEEAFSCENENITKLAGLILDQFKKVESKFPPLERKSVDYEVWEHVPKYGKRLSVWLWFQCPYFNNPQKYCAVGVQNICEYMDFANLQNIADDMGIELDISPSPTGIMFSTLEKKKVKKKEKTK